MQAHLQFARANSQTQNCKRACKANAEMKERKQKTSPTARLLKRTTEKLPLEAAGGVQHTTKAKNTWGRGVVIQAFCNSLSLYSVDNLAF